MVYNISDFGLTTIPNALIVQNLYASDIVVQTDSYCVQFLTSGNLAIYGRTANSSGGTIYIEGKRLLKLVFIF